jgi:hypothetical protein
MKQSASEASVHAKAGTPFSKLLVFSNQYSHASLTEAVGIDK